jgi:chromosome segregation ATPase
LPSRLPPVIPEPAMRSFQQNLLIIVALSLGGLCVYQWYGQTVQRNEIQALEKMVYEKSVAIQSYTNSINTMDRQIAQMDATITELKAAAKTNANLVLSQRREINRLQIASANFTNQISEYKNAVGSLEAKLKEAYDGIQKQNVAMKDLVAQRDEFVKKLNDSVKERNDIVNKYNDLASQVEKLQEASKK